MRKVNQLKVIFLAWNNVGHEKLIIGLMDFHCHSLLLFNSKKCSFLGFLRGKSIKHRIRFLWPFLNNDKLKNFIFCLVNYIIAYICQRFHK